MINGCDGELDFEDNEGVLKCGCAHRSTSSRSDRWMSLMIDVKNGSAFGDEEGE